MTGMPEPPDRTFVLLGSLDDSDAPDLQVWVRDDGCAQFHPDLGDRHWFLAGSGDTDNAMTWGGVLRQASQNRVEPKILGPFGDTR